MIPPRKEIYRAAFYLPSGNPDLPPLLPSLSPAASIGRGKVGASRLERSQGCQVSKFRMELKCSSSGNFRGKHHLLWNEREVVVAQYFLDKKNTFMWTILGMVSMPVTVCRCYFLLILDLVLAFSSPRVWPPWTECTSFLLPAVFESLLMRIFSCARHIF